MRYTNARMSLNVKTHYDSCTFTGYAIKGENDARAGWRAFTDDAICSFGALLWCRCRCRVEQALCSMCGVFTNVLLVKKRRTSQSFSCFPRKNVRATRNDWLPTLFVARGIWTARFFSLQKPGAIFSTEKHVTREQKCFDIYRSMYALSYKPYMCLNTRVKACAYIRLYHISTLKLHNHVR